MHGKPSIDELIAKCPTDLKQLGYAAVNGCSKPPSVGQLQSQGTGNSFHEIHQWNSLNFTSWSSYCSPLVSGVLGLRESWLILSISFTRANGLVMMAMMIIIYYYRVCVLPTIVSFFWNIPKGVSWIYEQVFIGFLRLELSRSIQPHFFMICSQGPFLMTMSSFHISAIRIFATWPSKKCLLAWSLVRVLKTICFTCRKICLAVAPFP
jgi:hypothetical protein